MTVLITGATGLVGRPLTQALLDSGLRLRVVTRRPHRALEMLDGRVTAFEWHPRTEPFPHPALEGVERVVNLMGESLSGPLTRHSRARIIASRCVATSRLVEALGRTRVHFIQASSAAVYGGGAGPPLTENTAVQAPKNKMSLALLRCEEEAERLRENGSIVTLVRFGAVIAPGSFPEPLRDLMARHLTWRKVAPEAGMPTIDHADAVALLAWLVKTRPMPGAVHAVAPHPLPTAELEKLVGDAARTSFRIPLPRWVLRREVGVLADLLHSRQQIVPQRALDAGFRFIQPDPLETVRAVLAQQPSPPASQRTSLLGAILQRP